MSKFKKWALSTIYFICFAVFVVGLGAACDIFMRYGG